MKFNPDIFWNLTLVEANLIVEGDKERLELDFMVQTYAVLNALGLTLGGKGYKFVNPFELKDENNNDKPQRTREDLLSELEELKQSFKR
jgi:hypothetical protein